MGQNLWICVILLELEIYFRIKPRITLTVNKLQKKWNQNKMCSGVWLKIENKHAYGEHGPFQPKSSKTANVHHSYAQFPAILILLLPGYLWSLWPGL